MTIPATGSVRTCVVWAHVVWSVRQIGATIGTCTVELVMPLETAMMRVPVGPRPGHSSRSKVRVITRASDMAIRPSIQLDNCNVLLDDDDESRQKQGEDYNLPRIEKAADPGSGCLKS